MIQAPRNLKQIVLMIITEVAARLDRCVRSKITSVSKMVVLPGPLQQPSQHSFLMKTAFFTHTSYERSNLFLSRKVTSSTVLTTLTN